MIDATQEYDPKYNKYPKRSPLHPKHWRHDKIWTKAKGVWYCYTCSQHYRVMGPRHTDKDIDTEN